MAARTLSWRTASRSGAPAEDSAEAQSTAVPWRTASARSSSGSLNSLATGHPFSQADESSLGRLVRGPRGRLPEKVGDLLVGVSQFYSQNNRFPLFRAQPPESLFVSLDFFHPDRFLER